MLKIKLFWLKYKDVYPNIFKLIQKLQTIFTSNGPLERTFSILKILVEWKRNRVTVEEINRRIFLRDIFKKK